MFLNKIQLILSMLYIREGYPQINEIVTCRVTKISGNTTFVEIQEYEKEGVLTISELSPGRIRSIKEFVCLNKVITCKVIRVEERTGRIDVSLRRVSIPKKIEKQKQVKEENFSLKIYTDLAKILKTNHDTLFEKTYEDIFEKYESVYEYFYELMLDNTKIEILTKLNENEKKELVNLINDKIKPENVEFTKELDLTSTEENGVDIIKDKIKNSLEKIKTKVNSCEVIYIKAGKYRIKIIADNLKMCKEAYNEFNS